MCGGEIPQKTPQFRNFNKNPFPKREMTMDDELEVYPNDASQVSQSVTIIAEKLLLL
jgi:hypothetical protein